MFKKLLIASLTVASFSVGILSCIGNNSANTDGDLSSVTEAGVVAVSSIADDASSGSIGISSVGVNSIQDLDLTADEFSCVNGWSSCSNGIKTRATNCSNPAVTYSKDVELSFFDTTGAIDAACVGLAASGNYVVKSGTEKLVIPINGDYTTTSDMANNYSGVPIGGGAQVTKNSSGAAVITVNGFTKSYTDRDGNLVWTHSIHTDPVNPLVLNHLARNGRTIYSGTVIVDHNDSSFTATMTFNNVTYTTTDASTTNCCYPVSGTLTVALTGSRTGTGTLTFSETCGTATYSGDISSETLMMITCTSSVD